MSHNTHDGCPAHQSITALPSWQHPATMAGDIVSWTSHLRERRPMPTICVPVLAVLLSLPGLMSGPEHDATGHDAVAPHHYRLPDLGLRDTHLLDTVRFRFYWPGATGRLSSQNAHVESLSSHARVGGLMRESDKTGHCFSSRAYFVRYSNTVELTPNQTSRHSL
jgi:hypothetical protein